MDDWLDAMDDPYKGNTEPVFEVDTDLVSRITGAVASGDQQLLHRLKAREVTRGVKAAETRDFLDYLRANGVEDKAAAQFVLKGGTLSSFAHYFDAISPIVGEETAANVVVNGSVIDYSPLQLEEYTELLSRVAGSDVPVECLYSATALRDYLTSNLRERAKQSDCVGAVISIRAGEKWPNSAPDKKMLAEIIRDLGNAYARSAERKGYDVEISFSEKELVLSLDGRSAFNTYGGESGLHCFTFRAEKIGNTGDVKKKGYLSVHVAPIEPCPHYEIFGNDIEEDPLSASTPGGQNANKVETGVRLTHTPTGITAVSRRFRSRALNRTRAMKVLTARVLDEQRTPDTSVRSNGHTYIRSYWLEGQNRIIDHKTETKVMDVTRFFEGDMDEFLTSSPKKDL